jgi:hypothetical protein
MRSDFSYFVRTRRFPFGRAAFFRAFPLFFRDFRPRAGKLLQPSRHRADDGIMLIPFRPTTSTQRQREFRARNPGYDAARKRAERARTKAALAQLAEQPQPAVAIAPQLLLPAPVQTWTLLDEMNAARQRETVAA